MAMRTDVHKLFIFSMCLFACLPGLDAEAVLDEHSDAEEDDPLHSHGKEVLANHVPRQWRTEAVLSW